jgi:hypothetical protein
MFFYALWWSFCVELDALRTVSHRPQRVKKNQSKREKETKEVMTRLVIALCILLALLVVVVLTYVIGFETMLAGSAQCEPPGIVDLLPTQRATIIRRTSLHYGAYNPTLLCMGRRRGYLVGCRSSTMHTSNWFLGLALRGYHNTMLVAHSKTTVVPSCCPEWKLINVDTQEHDGYKSAEDVRLFLFRRVVYGIGCTWDTQRRVHSPVLLRFRDCDLTVDYIGTFHGLDPHTPNKNWTAIVRGGSGSGNDDDRILIHRDTYPIFRVDILTDVCGENRLEPFVSIDLVRVQPQLFSCKSRGVFDGRHVRGTSNWCKWKKSGDGNKRHEQWTFVAHTQFRTPYNLVPLYRSMFLLIDVEDWRISAHTPWLNFDVDHARIQFASALAIEKDTIVVGMGINDRHCQFATYTRAQIERLWLYV